MFDWGLFEILLVLLVALVGLGPKRVANIMMVMGRIFGRMFNRYKSFKAELSEEIMQEKGDDHSLNEKKTNDV